MDRNEIISRISELPPGGITYKRIKGRSYAYYQWTEGGKQHSRRIKDPELEQMASLIEERKKLQELLRSGELGIVTKPYTDPGTVSDPSMVAEPTRSYKPRKSRNDAARFQESATPADTYNTEIRMGVQLRRFASPVMRWKKRKCYSELSDYIYCDTSDRVMILYGLRRTGKTTLIRQLICGMDSDMLDRTVFMQVRESNNMRDVNADLRRLENEGYRYVFIDEVTLLSDFIQGAALFSDIFAASGMKIVLSGTDSLGFLFSEDEQLFDRCIMIHTTFIPYREFERVLGISSIDDYISFGGTMSLSGVEYNHTSALFSRKNIYAPFSGEKTAGAYVDSAIARNIQHSLKNYQHEGHFRQLRDLYDNNELTNTINRVVEDINHRFTVDVLTRRFRSHDLGLAAANIRRDKTAPSAALDEIDEATILESYKKLLDILEKEEQSVQIDKRHSAEIREYLELLDIIAYVKLVDISFPENSEDLTILTQPGLRYAQATALVGSLFRDESIMKLPAKQRLGIKSRIVSEISGRMMEEIVLLETKLSRPDCEVFKLQFAVGEFDMVVFDPTKIECEIFEIKHSENIVPDQYRHLVDKEKCRATEFRYGTISGKNVIYRGAATTLPDEGINYLNVEEYLRFGGRS